MHAFNFIQTQNLQSLEQTYLTSKAYSFKVYSRFKGKKIGISLNICFVLHSFCLYPEQFSVFVLKRTNHTCLYTHTYIYMQYFNQVDNKTLNGFASTAADLEMWEPSWKVTQ